MPNIASETASQTVITTFEMTPGTCQDLMDELVRINEAVKPADILLVADAMTGQDAVNIAKSFNDALDIIDRDRVDARKRFVQKEKLRSRDERPRDLEPPPLATRERVGLALAQVLDRELIE